MEMRFEEIRKLDLEIIDGDRGDNYPSKDDFFSKEYCLFLSTENVTKNGFDFSNCLFINKEKDEKLRKGKLLRNDIIITTRGTVGNIAHYDNSVPFKNIRINSGMLIFRCGNLLVPKYFYYILKAPYFWKQLDNFMSGSAQPQLPKTTLNQMKVLLPSLANQQKIAAVLSSLDDKIALNNHINAKLGQMAKRLYDYWFVQFDFPGADGKPYKSNGGKMVWNEELKREIPEGWEVKKLGDLFTTNRGVSYSTATITGDGGIPMINLASFSPDGTYKVSGLKLFTGEYTKEKVLKPFDLVLCNTQQTAIDFTKDIIGKVLLVPDIFEGDITSSHHVNTLHVSNEDLKFYLYRLFNTDYFHKYISNYASGTNILGLDFSGVENFKAEIPPAELLAKFAKLMLNIEKKKSEVIKENQKLTAMRDKLLPLLMNGQVVVE